MRRAASTKQNAAADRERLFKLIEELVQWENTNNEDVLERARAEIWKSWRETCALNKNHPQAAELFNPHPLPAFQTPSPVAARCRWRRSAWGWKRYACDLNPVAVTINKAMIEIPPRFAGRAPVGPLRDRGGRRSARGLEGRAGPGRGRAPLRRVDARAGLRAHRPPLPA
ncbi:MAG: hypothetical protein KatS3mg126_2371 [Lysobacteraceae bacterium]|nr:MAG: hypothetical protein KatS3mg126_2371 [Xanthomonadaceae bacterium]